jgi:hypothetical protein
VALPLYNGGTGFALSPDGRTVATENPDRTVSLWEVASGKLRARLGTPAAPAFPQPASPFLRGRLGTVRTVAGSAAATLAFGPDGNTVAARGPAGSVRVWDVVTGKEVLRLKGHDADVTALALASDGRTLASGSADTTVLLWDVPRASAAARPSPAELGAGEVESLWADLGGDDAAQAFQAVRRLAAAPRQAVPLLRRHVRPTQPVEAGKLDRLVADLGSDKYRVRQRATHELEKLGELAVPALTRVAASPQSLETRRRAEQLLEKLTRPTLSPPQIRLVRAVEVLEEAGTAEARRLLAELARGAAGALTTCEARAALDRLAGNPAAQR